MYRSEVIALQSFTSTTNLRPYAQPIICCRFYTDQSSVADPAKLGHEHAMHAER